MITAVVPTKILRRWDALATAQLCEAAARLAEENEQLAQELRWADQSPGFCDCYAHCADRDHLPIGLMMDGQIVRVVPAEITL